MDTAPQCDADDHSPQKGPVSLSLSLSLSHSKAINMLSVAHGLENTNYRHFGIWAAIRTSPKTLPSDCANCSPGAECLPQRCLVVKNTSNYWQLPPPASLRWKQRKEALPAGGAEPLGRSYTCSLHGGSLAPTTASLLLPAGKEFCMCVCGCVGGPCVCVCVCASVPPSLSLSRPDGS